MDLTALVRSIVTEIFEQHKKGLQALSCVMVFAERDERLVACVREHLSEHASLVFLGENCETCTPARYILPYLSCSDMADLAAGKAPEKTSGACHAAVLYQMLSGNTVEVLEFEYKQFSQTAPVALYRLYESYEKTLATFGLKEIKRKQPDAVRFREDLVTASDVTKAQEQGATTLLVPVTAKVTPLAADAARNLNINILKGL